MTLNSQPSTLNRPLRLFSPENSHWYKPDGEPLHTVLSAKGEPRPTTLRDARKLGLLPSVTNVLAVINKPELVEWKMTQAVLAALTLPRLSGEGEDVFAKRVVEDAQNRVRTAAEFGTAFHAGAEQVANTLEVDPTGPYAAWLNLHRDWFQASCIRAVWTERVLVNTAFGYAGTADLLVEHQAHGLTLVDYKTQSVRPGLAPRAYASWCQQLAAYRAAIGKPMACMSVIVNSAEPSAPVEHLWGEDELSSGWESFEAALVIWRNEKGYDPRVAHQLDGAYPGATLAVSALAQPSVCPVPNQAAVLPFCSPVSVPEGRPRVARRFQPRVCATQTDSVPNGTAVPPVTLESSATL